MSLCGFVFQAFYGACMNNLSSGLAALKLVVVFIVGFAGNVWGAGMVPETPVIMVNVADGEGAINITNSDNRAALLYTALENLPEDEEVLLLVTQPVVRVEPGETQLIRFVMLPGKSIDTQRMKRVSFEGIPQRVKSGSSTVGMTVRQNLPIIVTPKDLPRKVDAWTLLRWSNNGQGLTVSNASRYVVRLSQKVDLVPSNHELYLPMSYLLPGQSHRFDIPQGITMSAASKVRIYPVNLYGFQVSPYEFSLN